MVSCLLLKGLGEFTHRGGRGVGLLPTNWECCGCLMEHMGVGHLVQIFSLRPCPQPASCEGGRLREAGSSVVGVCCSFCSSTPPLYPAAGPDYRGSLKGAVRAPDHLCKGQPWASWPVGGVCETQIFSSDSTAWWGGKKQPTSCVRGWGTFSFCSLTEFF